VKWDDPTIGIIGGSGRMGGWLGSVLKAQAVHFVNIGRDQAQDLPVLVRTCQVIVISVPIADTLEVIRQVAPHVPEDGLLMDLTSVKEAPLAEMMKWSQAQVVGVHPLFGPEGPAEEGGSVVLCPGRGEEGMDWVKALFERAGMGVLVLEADTHDRLMGMIQGMQHFVTLSQALALSRSDLDMETVKVCATTTFRAVLDRIFAMTSQSPYLFESLIMDNGYAAPFMEAYLKSAETLYSIVREKDRKNFEKLFNNLRERFHGGDEELT